MKTPLPTPDLSPYSSETETEFTELTDQVADIISETSQDGSLYDRRDISRRASELAVTHPELCSAIVPHLLDIVDAEVDRKFETSAARVVTENTAVAIQVNALRAIATCSGRRLVEKYVSSEYDIGDYVESLTAVLIESNTPSVKVWAIEALAAVSPYTTPQLVRTTPAIELLTEVVDTLATIESDERYRSALRIIAIYVSRAPEELERFRDEISRSVEIEADVRGQFYVNLLSQSFGPHEKPLYERFTVALAETEAVPDDNGSIRYWSVLEEFGTAVALQTVDTTGNIRPLLTAVRTPTNENIAMLRRSLGEYVFQINSEPTCEAQIEAPTGRYHTATGLPRRIAARVTGSLGAYTQLPAGLRDEIDLSSLSEEVRTCGGLPQIWAAEALGVLIAVGTRNSNPTKFLREVLSTAEGRSRRRLRRALGEWEACGTDGSERPAILHAVSDRMKTTTGTQRALTARAMGSMALLRGNADDGAILEQLQRTDLPGSVSTNEAITALGIARLAGPTTDELPGRLVRRCDTTEGLDHELAVRAVGEYGLTDHPSSSDPLVGLSRQVRDKADSIPRQTTRAFGFALTALDIELGVAVPELMEAVRSTVPQHRGAAAYALGVITALPTGAVEPALTPLLDRVADSTESIQWKLLQIIGYSILSRPDINPTSPMASRKELRATSAPARREIAIAVGILATAEHTSVQRIRNSLLDSVQSATGSERRQAAMALGVLVSFQEESQPDIPSVLGSKVRNDSPNRWEAARTIGELLFVSTGTTEPPIETLQAQLRTKPPHERHEPAYLLGATIAVVPHRIGHVPMDLCAELGSSTDIGREEDRRALGVVAGATDRADAIGRLHTLLEADLSREANEAYGTALKYLIQGADDLEAVFESAPDTADPISNALETWLNFDDPARRMVLLAVANRASEDLSATVVSELRRNLQAMLTSQSAAPARTKLAAVQVLANVGE